MTQIIRKVINFGRYGKVLTLPPKWMKSQDNPEHLSINVEKDRLIIKRIGK